MLLFFVIFLESPFFYMLGNVLMCMFFPGMFDTNYTGNQQDLISILLLPSPFLVEVKHTHRKMWRSLIYWSFIMNILYSLKFCSFVPLPSDILKTKSRVFQICHWSILEFFLIIWAIIFSENDFFFLSGPDPSYLFFLVSFSH